MPNSNGYVPSQDQIMGQLRILIPAVGSVISVLGIYSSEQTGALVASLLTAVGPISYGVGAIWSLYANTRKSIMTAAAKPAEPGLPAPQIVLPKEEAALAQTLPSNVNTTNDVKVVTK